MAGQFPRRIDDFPFPIGVAGTVCEFFTLKAQALDSTGQLLDSIRIGSGSISAFRRNPLPKTGANPSVVAFKFAWKTLLNAARSPKLVY